MNATALRSGMPASEMPRPRRVQRAKELVEFGRRHGFRTEELVNEDVG